MLQFSCLSPMFYFCLMLMLTGCLALLAPMVFPDSLSTLIFLLLIFSLNFVISFSKRVSTNKDWLIECWNWNSNSPYRFSLSFILCSVTTEVVIFHTGCHSVLSSVATEIFLKFIDSYSASTCLVHVRTEIVILYTNGHLPFSFILFSVL